MTVFSSGETELSVTTAKKTQMESRSSGAAQRKGADLKHFKVALREAGYSAATIKRVMPDWWSKEDEAIPAAVTQLKMIMARRLGLDMKSLLQHDRIEPAKPAGMRFKRAANLEEHEPGPETLAYCAAIARSVASAIEPSEPLPNNAAQLRQEVLARSAEPYLSLQSLLRYCWQKNVAVVHVRDLPGKRKGMDALVYRFDGRNVIVATREMDKNPPAWASFIIAHELAHIALGHVRDNEALIDDADKSNPKGMEAQANRFAQDVLAGPNVDPFWLDYCDSPERLSRIAHREGVRRQIDPGHIILRCGKDKGFPFVMKAWQQNPSNACASHQVINQMALDRIEFERIGEETSEMLEKVLELVQA